MDIFAHASGPLPNSSSAGCSETAANRLAHATPSFPLKSAVRVKISRAHFVEREPRRITQTAKESVLRNEPPRSRQEGGHATLSVYREHADRKMTESAAVQLREKVLGAVLGAAIGDALGYPVEFIRSAQEIRDRYGPEGVTGYVRYRQENGQRFAPYSDDTQMAEVVLRSLIWSRECSADLDETMRHMAKGFVLWSRQPQGGHRAPGNACMMGCRALRAGDPWQVAGAVDAGGCGSVMRAYPFGLVLAADADQAEAWAVAHSKMTHRAPIALAACAAMSLGVAASLESPTAADAIEAMIDAAGRHDASTAAMIGEASDRARRGDDPEVVLARYLGWAAHEAIAAAAYVFLRHPDEPRAALLEAVNSPGDSDSIGTLVGALAGARCGIGALPAPWIDDLERSAELRALAEMVLDDRRSL